MTPFTQWLGQQWWCMIPVMWIDLTFTKVGRKIIREGKMMKKLNHNKGIF